MARSSGVVGTIMGRNKGGIFKTNFTTFDEEDTVMTKPESRKDNNNRTLSPPIAKR